MPENSINERYTIMKDDIETKEVNNNYSEDTLETPLLDENNETTDNCFYNFIKINLCAGFIGL